MAVRRIDSAADIQRSIGALSGMTHGTIVTLVKRTAVGLAEDSYVFILETSADDGKLNFWFQPTTDDLRLGDGDGNNTGAGPIVVDDTTDWYLIVVRKPSGTSTVRWSVYNFTSATWSHGNGTNAVPDAVAPGAGGFVNFTFEGVAEAVDGLMAAQAAWSNTLPWSADTTGDSAIEAAGLETDLDNWLAASPDAAWAFNQNSTDDAVNDLTAGGSDQTSVVGTDVVAGEDPAGFDFGSAAQPAPESFIREFDGVDDDLATTVGALDAMQYGTVAVILKRGATGITNEYFNLETSGGDGKLAIFFHDTDQLRWGDGDGSNSGTGPIIDDTDDWYLIVVRKATGSATPRWSIYNFTSDTWTHADSNATAPDAVAVGATGIVTFGFEGNFLFTGRAAIRAAWSNSLGPSGSWTANASGDAAIEAAGLEIAAFNWVDASPDAGWLLNQDSASDPVTDFTGNGADQSLITGTTVIVGDDPPGFDFSLTAGTPYGRVTETETARGFTAAKTTAAGRVTEVETARSFATAKTADFSRVAEVEAARAFAVTFGQVYGRVAETEQVRRFSAAKTVAFGRVTETETARILADQPTITPPDRTFAVLAENRTFSVLAEDRTFTVTAESRRFAVT